MYNQDFMFANNAWRTVKYNNINTVKSPDLNSNKFVTEPQFQLRLCEYEVKAHKLTKIL